MRKEDTTVAVALIGAIPKLLWPILILWSVLLFQKPIYDLISAAANQITGGGAAIDIAGLKISLPKNSVPLPPYRVKYILPELDAEILSFMVENRGEDGVHRTCYTSSDPDEFREDSVPSRLK